ncbi:ornithine carbamoyltransferase [Salpingoeca rosetta]|uniref:ornithine carbamoyltransferase n=1 Tax=Salpingoeca rosetta (strain ATCC 50818 / BSB-021) TaxID=946362 RepID=F2US18_SALR5|nr:ornithine carbamoyltransferase [Salpingoeca rosetta]EGD80423.1 ornithine carbamoyltransferase [Salpingoeca rosetta]|eukprot:XP_004987987.1 ornithine carbamoyltransferase [Salpingoeca rosetta]
MHAPRHFLGMLSVSRGELTSILRGAVAMKAAVSRDPTAQLQWLQGRTMAMVFEKPSLRTHTSFQTGMHQLGGNAIYLGPEQIGLGKREPIKDVSRVLSRMTDIIIARVFSNESIRELAAHSSVPVINALCDVEHPCQAVADMLTILEHKGRLDSSLKVTFVGDGNNNVTHSLALACAQLGVNFTCASPTQHSMDAGILKTAQDTASATSAAITQTVDVAEAVTGADVVYTDTFVSMGQEDEKEQRLCEFDGYQSSCMTCQRTAALRWRRT